MSFSSLILKVEDVKRPLKPEEVYEVLCFVEESKKLDKLTTTIIPLINHLHTDFENGQYEPHYHADFRFIKTEIHREKYSVLEQRLDSKYANIYEFSQSVLDLITRTRIVPKSNYRFEYRNLRVINRYEDHNFENFSTSTFLIKNSKLIHKCIHKGKCPHKGYDLSQVPEIDGVITCPLHSLQFDAKTKQLINEHKN